ncbi:hypothetical protein AB0K47_11435 [Streptomyces tirandamycinicus]|uniref:hypothetical protein n=1 Tax=Streptomyces tirandamycinicus TaxID=2174846 RepID=UPI00343FBC8A
MNTPWAAVAAATAFVWFGMVLAISFIEAPLKFRAPDVTLRIGLGIGRLVFRALNRAEAVLAAVLVVAVAAGGLPAPVVVPAVLVVGLLLAQLLAVRPVLNRRSDRVLAGEDVPRSRAHLVYIACESAKAILLPALGVAALSV